MRGNLGEGLRRGAPAAAWTRCGCGVGTRAAAQDGGSAGEAAALGHKGGGAGVGWRSVGKVRRGVRWRAWGLV